MKISPPAFTSASFVLLVTIFSAAGESATFGWHTTTSGGSYVSGVYMLGPTTRNKVPEKKGVFKGEFISRAGDWQSKLTAIYKLSLGSNGELQTQKVGFTLPALSSYETVETNGWKGVKIRFATASVSFEPEESLVLVFKSKVETSDGMKDHIELVTVRIIRLFVPS
jgi:hypothetical protein